MNKTAKLSGVIYRALSACHAAFDFTLFESLVRKRLLISRDAILCAREKLLIKRLGLERGWVWSKETIHCETCQACRCAAQDLIIEYNGLRPNLIEKHVIRQ